MLPGMPLLSPQVEQDIDLVCRYTAMQPLDMRVEPMYIMAGEYNYAQQAAV